MHIFLRNNALLSAICTDVVAMAATIKSQRSIISLCSCCQIAAHLWIEGLGIVAQELLFGSVRMKHLWPSVKWLFSTCGGVSENIFAMFRVVLKHKISDYRDILTPVLIPLLYSIACQRDLLVFWNFQMGVDIYQEATMCTLFSVYPHWGLNVVDCTL